MKKPQYFHSIKRQSHSLISVVKKEAIKNLKLLNGLAVKNEDDWRFMAIAA